MIPYRGNQVSIEFAIVDDSGAADPSTLTFLPLGYLRTNTMSDEWDTLDATSSSTEGNTKESLASWLTRTISLDGLATTTDNEVSNLNTLLEHVRNPQTSDGQPTCWIRRTGPLKTHTIFMLCTSVSEEAPYDDLGTQSLKFTAAPAASGTNYYSEDTAA